MNAPCNEIQIACNESICRLCGTALKVQSRGRPRRFCTPAHRVRYHRQQKRSDNGSAQASLPIPQQPPTTPERGTDSRVEVLSELAYTLEDLRPPGRLAELRRLAEQADDLSLLFDTIERSAWAVDELSEVESVLERLLRNHRRTLQRLSDLYDLADDVQLLAHDLRGARSCQGDLEWAIEELEASDEQMP